MVALKEVFGSLKGEHIPKDKKDEAKPLYLNQKLNPKGIDCCDVVAGDCNAGACQ